MKKEHLDVANQITKSIEDCEHFISHCDHCIRNATPGETPMLDRFIPQAVEDGIISHHDIMMLLTDLRDIATVKLQDLDKRLEAL